MLDIIYSISLDKQDLSNKNDNLIYSTDLSQSIFNQLNKFLIRQEREFDNVLTDKKKDDQSSIIANNFVISNLLNIVNQKESISLKSQDNCISSDAKKDNTSEKKIDKHYNGNYVKDFNIPKKTEKNLEEYRISENESLCNKLHENKYTLLQINPLKNFNQTHNLYLKKLNNEFFQKNKNFFYEDRKNIKFLKNEKNFYYLENIKNQKNTFLSSKNKNPIEIFINQKFLSKEFDKKEKEDIKSFKLPLFLSNEKKIIKLNKLISQKILFSIANKNNKAEIHLKPEFLGTIHININIKNNNQAMLNFISYSNEVRTFLDNHMSFLRDALKKKGIKLKKFNIYSSFKNKNLINHKKFLYNNIFDTYKLRSNSNKYKNNLEEIKYKSIDIYV
ncbi:flagellar hook-length control protein FliK [Buchnera aphidicola]|uniref:Flagellar hook-length control protein-like C-terminal domain-containing protein n=1 Tax=Buchnera aphidicola (Artemisaphis artemisicola) TaxID=1241836 RepID=A0A4D6XP82_9GAMM|nr:flagellar hook-length control protein FliK [Buchnera aphidicola]QCI15771.1 hypothetical protein D9V59_00370 [Buchnera aphidicola (Artemisaphis artemisicola)]